MIMYFFQKYLHLSIQEVSNLYYMLISHDDIFKFLKDHEIYISIDDCEHIEHLIDDISDYTLTKDKLHDTDD